MQLSDVSVMVTRLGSLGQKARLLLRETAVSNVGAHRRFLVIVDVILDLTENVRHRRCVTSVVIHA